MSKFLILFAVRGLEGRYRQSRLTGPGPGAAGGERKRPSLACDAHTDRGADRQTPGLVPRAVGTFVGITEARVEEGGGVSMIYESKDFL